jgi:hypothetical protein
MKKNMIYLMLAIAFVLTVSFDGLAQKPTARNLYIEREKNSTLGQPGAKVAIELNRNGKTSMVSPDYEFKSGDRIRLVLDINFKGYAALINEGTTGKKTLLYPYKGVSSEVFPSGALKIPNTDWIKFDNNKGIEKLVVIFSGKPIPELAQMFETPSPETPTTTSPTSTGGMANADEQAQILAELNSRSLKRSKKLKNSRDLSIEPSSDGNYVVTNDAQLNDVIGFELFLKHN